MMSISLQLLSHASSKKILKKIFNYANTIVNHKENNLIFKEH